MTKQQNREEALARIMAVAQEIADREAAAVQALIDQKAKRKAAKLAWRLANPEKWKEAQRKKTAKRDERRRQRMAIDPVYAEEVRQKHRDQYLKQLAREGAEKLNQRTREGKARRMAEDPEKHRQKQAEYDKNRKEKQAARMASDPVYAEAVRAQRRAWNKAKKARDAAELKALREWKASLEQSGKSDQ